MKREKAKAVLGVGIKSIVILVAGILLGTFLMILAFCLPEELMVMHMQESVPAISEELGSAELLVGFAPTYNGSYTDFVMLQNAIYDEGHSIIEKAMGIYRNGQEDGMWWPKESLLEYLQGETTFEYSYARYWHGYLVILKPLLLLFKLGDIQLINQMVQMILLGLVIVGLVKRNKDRYAWAYGLAFLFLVPIIMPFTLSLSICFDLYLILNLLQLKFHDKWMHKAQYFYFFLLSGMITSFVDFLTYPLVTLGMPLVFYFIFEPADKMKQSVYHIIKYSVAWGFGYIGMWAGKWLVGSLLLRQNVLADAGNTLALRMDEIVYDSRILSFLNVVWYNIRMYRNWPCVILFLAIIIVLIVLVIKKSDKNSRKEYMVKAFPFLIIALMPFAWYFVALNHSGEHYVFTFRALVVTAFAGISMLMSMYQQKSK